MKKKKSPTCKSKKVARERIYKKLDEVFIVSLKSIIASLVTQIPKEFLIAGNQHIYKTYTDLKDSLLKHIVGDYSVKDREKLWEALILIYTDVLHPLIQAINKPDPAFQSSLEEGDKILNYAIKASSIDGWLAISKFVSKHLNKYNFSYNDTKNINPPQFNAPHRDESNGSNFVLF